MCPTTSLASSMSSTTRRARTDVSTCSTRTKRMRGFPPWCGCTGAFVAGTKDAMPDYLSVLASHGYTVASIEYTKAPEATYPTPVRQVSDAISFLVANADTYHVDPAQLVLAGDSAGLTSPRRRRWRSPSRSTPRTQGSRPPSTRTRCGDDLVQRCLRPTARRYRQPDVRLLPADRALGVLGAEGLRRLRCVPVGRPAGSRDRRVPAHVPHDRPLRPAALALGGDGGSAERRRGRCRHALLRPATTPRPSGTSTRWTCARPRRGKRWSGWSRCCVQSRTPRCRWRVSDTW